MPFGKGKGPRGQGPGRGTGRGSGQGRMGRIRPSAGPGGYCICPDCGERIVHQVGVPCYSVNCPKCGAQMVRE